MTTQVRRAARVLVLDPDDRLLLLEGRDSTDPAAGTWWFTVGGGLHDGETPRAAALRELAEETGTTGVGPDDLVGPVWSRRAAFAFEGLAYDQEEVFFLLRVAAAFDVDDAAWVPLERRSLLGHRWWPLDELDATSEVVFPAGLGPLLRALLRDGPPAEPLRLPDHPPR